MSDDDFRKDLIWSDTFKGQISETLTIVLASKILRFVTASDYKDKKEATDMEPFVDMANNAGSVGVRMRRGDIKYRDLTLRSWRISNVKTELEKVIEGWGRWYFYGWASGHRVGEWMVLCMDTLRKSGLLSRDRRIIKNRDNTSGFSVVSFNELSTVKCIVKCKIVKNEDSKYFICIVCDKRFLLANAYGWPGEYQCADCWYALNSDVVLGDKIEKAIADLDRE